MTIYCAQAPRPIQQYSVPHGLLISQTTLDNAYLNPLGDVEMVWQHMGVAVESLLVNFGSKCWNLAPPFDVDDYD